MAAPLTLLLIVSVSVRAFLFRSALADFISERVEVVSPLTAWKRGTRAPAPFGGCSSEFSAGPLVPPGSELNHQTGLTETTTQILPFFLIKPELYAEPLQVHELTVKLIIFIIYFMLFRNRFILLLKMF